MKIDLILPTFNNEQFTINCVKSINENVEEEQNINIIWVDNNSSNESRNIVAEQFKKLSNVTFEKIFLSENLGFIKAVNIGIKYLLEKNNSDFIGILNNDIEVGKHWLSELINALKSDEKIVCAGSIQYVGDKNNGRIELRDFNFSGEFSNIPTSSFLEAQKNINNYEFKNPILTFDTSNFSDYQFKNTYIAYYSTLFKPFIFREVGLLNENFNFGYADDVEFNFEITKAGYKIAKCFKSLVFHNSRSTFKIVFNNINGIQEANRIQLKISKTLNQYNQKKIVMYTAIIGNYDNFKDLNYYDHDNYDYICFTDSKNILNNQNNIWKNWLIFDVTTIKNSLNMNNTLIARYFKTHPHYFFENYEKSIWIDGNVNVLKNIDNYVNLLAEDHYILCYDHPFRNCIYQECDACRKLNKDIPENIKNIENFLINENYPKNNGLIQSNILVRRHNNKECIFLMEKWWEMIKNYSKRDQLSFNYVFWKYGGKYLTNSAYLILQNFFNHRSHAR